jgi:alpha-glucosidase
MSEHSVVTELPEGDWEALEGHGFQSDPDERNIGLHAWGAWFGRRT